MTADDINGFFFFISYYLERAYYVSADSVCLLMIKDPLVTLKKQKPNVGTTDVLF